MNRLFALAACSAIATMGCNKSPGSGNITFTETPGGAALPTDHPAIPNLGLKSASAQRMSVPQLMATYPQMFGSLPDGGPVTWMIGNSPKSDINPALEAGLNAVLVPHPHTWVLEHQELRTTAGARFLQVERFADLRHHF